MYISSCSPSRLYTILRSFQENVHYKAAKGFEMFEIAYVKITGNIQTDVNDFWWLVSLCLLLFTNVYFFAHYRTLLKTTIDEIWPVIWYNRCNNVTYEKMNNMQAITKISKNILKKVKFVSRKCKIFLYHYSWRNTSKI